MTRSCPEPRATLIAVGRERGTSGEYGVVSLCECGIDGIGAKCFLCFLFFVSTTGLVEGGLVILCTWRKGHGREEGGSWRETGGRDMEGDRREGNGGEEGGRREGHGCGEWRQKLRGGANKLKQNEHLDD